MSKIKEMSEGIVVEDAPPRKTTIDGVMAKGKRSATNGRYAQRSHSTSDQLPGRFSLIMQLERLFCSLIYHLARFCEVFTAALLSDDAGMLTPP